MSQSFEHKADHRRINKRFAAVGQSLVVAAQSSLPTEPGEGALNNPTLGQQYEALLVTKSLHDLQRPAQLTLHPFDQLASVTTVCPYELQATKSPPMRISRFLDTLKQCLEHAFTSISILHRASSDHHQHYQHYQTQCVHNQVSLATSDFLGCIVASLLATFCRLDALTVEYGCAWCLVASNFLAQLFSQCLVEPFPSAIYSPQPKVMVHSSPGWKVVRQCSPQAAILGHVEDGVQNLSPTVLAWASRFGGFWHKWRNYRPLFIIQISRVDFAGLIDTHSPSLPDCPIFA